jgi:Fe-S cluster assembly protein SufD
VTFDGRIIVAPDAQQTEAYQENHNIVLSEGARVETTPQLEIYADDVKCSHGATTGRLDEDALFYMRTRGVPEAEAKVLQMISFLAAVTPEDRKEEIENAVNQLV